MLDNLTDFVQALHTNGRTLALHHGILLGEMYCPNCAGARRMCGVPLYSRALSLFNPLNPPPSEQEFLESIAPSLFKLTCFQCDAEFTVVIYDSLEGRAMAAFSDHAGGSSTPHTPEPVAYYLDQAHRAQSVGANSAAVAMYRGALDQLLFHEGYPNGTLGKKLEVLEKDIKAGTAPIWARELEIDYLSVLNQLGSGSIHPNDGGHRKQLLLDNELLVQMREAFGGLLYLVYEVPHQRGRHLTALKNTAQLLKKK